MAPREIAGTIDVLLDDLDGLGDGKPSILLFIDTSIDKGTGLRNCSDELVKRAPAKQVFG